MKSQRERLVVILIVATIVPLAAMFLIDKVLKSFEAREMQYFSHFKQKQTHERNIAQSKMAIKRLENYERQALSSDPLTARASLQSWLASTAEELFVPETVVVRPVGTRPLRDDAQQEVGEQITYRVSARGDLQQLTRFLHRFYSMNTLHRIGPLNIKPRQDSKLLDLVIIVDALSLTSAKEGRDSEHALSEGSNHLAMASIMSTSAVAPFASVLHAVYPIDAKSTHTTMLANKLWRDVFSSDPPARFAYDDNSYSEYAQPILTRNLFGEVNRRPQFASIKPQNGTTKERYSLEIQASDDDEYDKLRYRLVGEPPVAAKLETSSRGDSATLTFTPPEAGEYEFTVAVADDGLPSKEDQTAFTVKVGDPRPVEPRPMPRPPEPPKFDFAKYTEVQAFLRGRDGTWEVWLHVKPRDEGPLRLRVGDTFDIGSVKGRVQDIGPTSVILDVDGEPREYTRGEALTAGSRAPEI